MSPVANIDEPIVPHQLGVLYSPSALILIDEELHSLGFANYATVQGPPRPELAGIILGRGQFSASVARSASALKLKAPADARWGK